MNKRTYSPVTRADVERIRNGIGKFGIKMPTGDDVEIKGPFGVRMGFNYDEREQNLTLTILHKPGIISNSQIWSVIEMTAGKEMRKNSKR